MNKDCKFQVLQEVRIFHIRAGQPNQYASLGTLSGEITRTDMTAQRRTCTVLSTNSALLWMIGRRLMTTMCLVPFVDVHVGPLYTCFQVIVLESLAYFQFSNIRNRFRHFRIVPRGKSTTSGLSEVCDTRNLKHISSF